MMRKWLSRLLKVYVITDFKNTIIPIEVKVGNTGSLRSLQMTVRSYPV
jgi:hypothetical protein